MRATPENTTLAAALAYLRAGLSVIPVRRDGSKAPAIGSWEEYQRRLPTGDEARGWWGVADPPGIAVIGGSVSGNLECLDFDADAQAVFEEWRDLVEAEAPGLSARLSVARTPKPGYHVRYRALGELIPGNTKLASDPTRPRNERTLIETRGEGGYAVAPGSPAAVHVTGRPYVHLSGPKLSQVQTVTAAEREVLIRCALSFDRVPPEEPHTQAPRSPEYGLQPGDDYCVRGPDWAQLLEPAGWRAVRESGAQRFWARPGLDRVGWSATTGLRSKGGRVLLIVFSSNADPFEGPSGGRNSTSYNKFAAYALLRHGGDYSAAARDLAGQGYGTRAQTPPGARPKPPPVQDEPWEPPIPLGTPPLAEPFPLDTLPLPVRDFAREVAWATNSPPDFAACFCLGAASAALGNSRVLAITRTHLQPACLYIAIVGGPGSGKTPALEHAREPLDDAERRYRDQWQAAREEWLNEDPDARGPRPVLRRVVVDDTTTEALVRTLSENSRGLGMVRDELAALFTGLNQYRDGGKGHDRQIYLKIWSRSRIQVDRRGNPDAAPVTVARPYVAIVGGIQPDVIDWIRGERQNGREPPDDGFLDRFLVSYPAELPDVEEQWRDVSETAAQGWARIVGALLDVPMHPERDGLERPWVIHLDGGGRDAWVEFTRAHARELNGDDFPTHLRGAWAKMRGYCGRLALVLQLLRQASGVSASQAVEGASVDAAARLVRYFKNHVLKVRAVMGSDPRTEGARRILCWLERHPDLHSFSRRDLYQDLRRAFKAPEALLSPLRLLIECRYLRLVTGAAKGTAGGRPADRYEVNPLWKRTQRTQNPPG